MLGQELPGAEPLLVPEIAADVDKRLRGRLAFYEEMEDALFLASDRRDVEPLRRVHQLPLAAR